MDPYLADYLKGTSGIQTGGVYNQLGLQHRSPMGSRSTGPRPPTGPRGPRSPGVASDSQWFEFVDRWFARIPRALFVWLAVIGGGMGVGYAGDVGVGGAGVLWYAAGGALAGFAVVPAAFIVLKLVLAAMVVGVVLLALYACVQFLAS